MSVMRVKGVFQMFVVDIAKRVHEAFVIDGSDELIQKPFSFKNTTQGFKQFLVKFYKISYNKEDFIIAMEATNHHWVAILSAVYRREYPVKVMNPIKLDAFRNLDIR